MTHDDPTPFDLELFLPYLLNQAAEATSQSFQAVYREAFGMTRTQWRIMANLGKYGAMTAARICAITHIEKTKVSRGVLALEGKGFLVRQPAERDRRTEMLALTNAGCDVFRHLGREADAYDNALRQHLGEDAAQMLVGMLKHLSEARHPPFRGST
jgi:DNA-binding MarR family transcriptional regulator